MNTKWVLTFNRNASFPRLESDKEKHWRKFQAKKCVWNEWHCVSKIKKYLFLIPICRFLKAYRLTYSISKICIEKKLYSLSLWLFSIVSIVFITKVKKISDFSAAAGPFTPLSPLLKKISYTIAVLSIIFLDIQTVRTSKQGGDD